MPVNTTIPLTQDYLEATVTGFDYISGLILPPGGQSLYACGGLATGKFLKISSDLATHTTLTFPGDGKHEVPIDLCYAPSTGKVYVLFANASNGQITIGTVNPNTPTIEADFLNADATGDFDGPISITTDDTHLYIVSELDTPSQTLKYRLIDGAGVLAGQTTGFTGANGIRYMAGKLFAHGVQAPGTAWIVRIDAQTMAVEQSVSFAATGGAGLTHDFALSDSVSGGPRYLWIGSKDTAGIIRRYEQQNLSNVVTFSTSQISKCTETETDGKDIWGLFENGRAVRIHPASLSDQRIYTLNQGQGFQSELCGDGTYMYTAWKQVSTKISRYHIPSEFVDVTKPSNISIVTPAAGAVVSGIITLEGTASDAGGFEGPPSGVEKIEWSIFINNVLTVVATSYKDTEGRFRSSFDTNRMFNGAQSFFSRAFDFAGNFSPYLQRAVTINNTPVIVQAWAKQIAMAAGGKLGLKCVTVDSSGNIYAIGGFVGTINFGSGITKTSTASGDMDIFLAKYDSAGTCLWGRSFGSIGQDIGYGVTCDSSGNVIITGTFFGTIEFGEVGNSHPISTGNNTLNHTFLVKFNSSGVCQWAKHYGGSLPNNEGKVVACYGTDIFLLTQYYVTMNFGGTDLPFYGSTDIALAKFDSSGTAMWSNASKGYGFGSSNFDEASGMAIDSSGNVFITGNNRASIDFGGGALRVGIYADMYLAKFQGSDGTHLWSFCKGSTNGGQCTAGASGAALAGFGAVAVDSSGNAVDVGAFSKTVNFGGADKIAASGSAFYRAKYNGSSHAHIWSEKHGGEDGPSPPTDAASAVAIGGAENNISVVGSQTYNIDFGDGRFTFATAGGNGFLACYKSNGDYRVHKVFPATGPSHARSVKMLGDDIIVGGEFTKVLSLENGVSFTQVSDNNEVADGFIVKYSPPV